MNNNLIHVSSKLMQNYHLGHPVSAGTQIATFVNSSGQVEVISIGSDFKLYNFYPDATGTTWAMKKIELPNNAQAKEVVAGTTNGMPQLLVKVDKIIKGKGLNSLPLLTLSRNGGPEMPFVPSYLCELGGMHFDPIYEDQPNSYMPVDPDSIFLHSRQMPAYTNRISSQKERVQLAYSGKSVNDNFFITHIVDVNFKDKSSVRNIATLSKDIYSSAILGYKDPKQDKLKFGVVAANVNPSVKYENFNRVEFRSTATNDSRNFAQGNNNTCSQVATTHLPNAAFAIRSKNKSLVYLTSSESVSNAEYNLTVLSNIVGEDGEVKRQKMEQVYATTDTNLRPVAFTLDKEGNLYHTELKEDGTWSFLSIVESHLKFKHLSISKDSLGNPNIFGVTTKTSGAKAGQLWRIWLDNDQEVDLWQKEEIEIESSIKAERKAHEISTYSSEITVYDRAGVLKPNAKVKIWSSGSQNLIINGKGYITNRNHPVNVLSTDAGKITIISPTNDIAASIIHVWTEFMDDDKGVAIRANGDIQDKFSKITADEILNAQGQSDKLLKGKYANLETAQSMAEALNSSMSIIEHSRKADSKLKHENYSRVISGAKCDHVMSESFGKRLRINADQNYTDSWKLSFASGLPVYSKLTYSETFHQSYKRDIETLEMKSHGFLDFLSDVWRMVKEGVAELVEIVINGVKAAVTVLIDGVHKIWRGIVNFVDEIFQAVLGFFESVKVFFVDIFHWLGTIFNWKNILRTKEVINHSFNEMLDFIGGPVIQFAKDKVDGQILKLEGTIHTKIKEYIDSIDVGRPIVSHEDQQRHNISTVASVENNVITNAVTNNYRDADNVTIGNVHESISDAFDKLKPIGDDFSSSKEWEKAVAYFGQMKSNPDKILELAMAGLLELVEVIAIWALEKIKGALDAFFDAISELIKVIKDALNKPFYIPLVTEIYNFVKHHDDDNQGLPFSYLDMGSIMIAMPTTVVSTLIIGKAPFPDDESVIAFKQFFTKDWLSRKIGINKSLKQDEPETDTALQGLNNFFNILSGVTYIQTAIIKPLVDTVTIGHEVSNDPTITAVLLRFLSFSEAYLNTVGWIASTPWATEPQDEFSEEGFILLYHAWIIELFDDIIMDWIFCVLDPEGKIESGITTAFSSLNLILYIDLAVKDPSRGFNISKTLPGVFSFGRPVSAQLPLPYGPPAGAAVLALIDIVSNGVMAGYSFAAVKTDN